MKIKEPGIHRDSIVVSKKTGIAVGVIPGPSTTTKTVPKCMPQMNVLPPEIPNWNGTTALFVVTLLFLISSAGV